MLYPYTDYPVMFPLLGFLILALDIVALFKLWNGSSKIERKLVWTTVILILPFLGMVLYFLLGKSNQDSQVEA